MLNKWKYVVVVALTFTAMTPPSESANILAFLPSCSPSHLIIEMAAVREMAERQHNVTVVSVLPLKSDLLHPNMTVIQLDKGSVDMDHIIQLTKLRGFQKFYNLLHLLDIMSMQMSVILDDHKFQELLNNPGNKFDLLVYGYLFSDYFFGIAEHFDCPIALIWPNIANVHILNIIGSPLEISYTSLSILNTPSEESIGLMFRLKNLFLVATDLVILAIQDWRMSKIYM